VSADKLRELEATISSVQSMQTVDDDAIKDLMAQINDAKAATKEIEKTKADLKKSATAATQTALDAVEQMKQDLARLNQVTAQVQTTVADAIPAQLDSISNKVKELEAENNGQFNELTRREDWLTAVAPNAEPVSGALAPARNQFNLPGIPTPTVDNQLALPGVSTDPANPPINPAAAKIAQQATQQKDKLRQAMGTEFPEEEPMAESAFNRSIAWATGKKL
jgi:DNA repair exonuclease SbcCD ATPase subunit